MFVLGVAKIAWTVHSRPPALAASLRRWERAGATAVHHLFYVMMVLIPLTGYLVSTSEGQGIDMWGWFTIPAVVVAGEGLRDLAIEAHYWFAYGSLAIAAVHAAAAIKHQLLDRDGTLRRMPW